MMNKQTILSKPIFEAGGVHCKRCGHLLTNPMSIKLEYCPVCWQKIEVELWIRDVVVPEVQPPILQMQRKSQNFKLVEQLMMAHRLLEEYFFKNVESHLADIQISQVALAEV